MTHLPLLLSLALLSPLLSHAHNCTQAFREEAQHQMPNSTRIQSCRRKLLAAEFAWSFDKASRRLNVALGAKLHEDTGWLAWGVNPDGPQMAGTRAIISIKHRNGSFEWHKYNVTEATKARRCQLLPADEKVDIGVEFTGYRMEYIERLDYYMIVATVMLPEKRFNSSRTHVVWQIGKGSSGSEVLMHPKSLNNFDSTETLDLETVQIISDTRHRRGYLRLAHGVVNIVGWGTLLPSGVIVARYMRVFPKPCKRWYDVHVSCQTAGYILGSGGWVLGLWLGKASENYKFNIHNTAGMIIFILATIQMLAWRLRPAPGDGYRMYWNMYHHFLGYAILALISFNIFLGIKILEPQHLWKWAYIGVVGTLGTVVLAFEVLGWIKFLIQKSSSSKQG